MTDIIEPTPPEAATFDAEAAEVEQAVELGAEGVDMEVAPEAESTGEAMPEEEAVDSPEKRSAGFFESMWEGVKQHPVYSALATFEGLVATPLLVNIANRQFTGQNPLESVYHVLSRADVQQIGGSALGLAAVTLGISAALGVYIYKEGKEFAEEGKPELLEWQVKRAESSVEMYERFLADATERFEQAKAEQEAKEAELEGLKQKQAEGVAVVSEQGYSIDQLEYLANQGREYLESGFFESSIAHWQKPLAKERAKLEKLRVKVK